MLSLQRCSAIIGAPTIQSRHEEQPRWRRATRQSGVCAASNFTDRDAALNKRIETPDLLPMSITCPAVALLSVAIMALPAAAPALENVGQVFGMSCAGCHPGGGNIINRGGATLSLPDLQRNGMLSDDGMYNLISRGKGAMPGFGKECTPQRQCTFGARLPEEDIRELATYVLTQANNGWRS